MLALTNLANRLILADAPTSSPTTASAADSFFPLTDPAGILAILLTVLALIFWMTQHRVFGRIFKVVPALVFCYFLPTALTTAGIIPDSSPLYSWIKTFVLPAALLLLILALDVPGIIRLGPKAIIMLLAGTAGIVIGGPVSLLICHQWLPEEAWRGMTALSGSWIGGGANFVALGEAARVTPDMLGAMVVPDVFVASIWMGILLYLSQHQKRIDSFTGANAQAIRDLEVRMTDFHERVTRVPKLPDLIIILMFGFLGSWLAYWAGGEINSSFERRLTIDGVKLTAETDAEAFAEIVQESEGNTKRRLLVLSVVREETADVTGEADGQAFGRSSATAADEIKLDLDAPEIDLLNELSAYINANVAGWTAELSPEAEAAAEKPSTRLRQFSRSAVLPGGLALRLPDHTKPTMWNFHTSLAASTWKFIIVTALGVVLSFTRARNLEGAGASKLGSVMIYLLVACIGASANFAKIIEVPAYILMGFIWIFFHIIVLLTVGWLIKSPIFFLAVGSQSNIGGAASAPVVAAAYHPSLAPVGALLAVAGYVLGTYAGLVCMNLLKWVAQSTGG